MKTESCTTVAASNASTCVERSSSPFHLLLHFVLAVVFDASQFRYSIPLPKGGRHSTDIILCEDQLLRNRKPKPKADDAFDAAAAGFGAIGVSHSENVR